MLNTKLYWGKYKFPEDENVDSRKNDLYFLPPVVTLGFPLISPSCTQNACFLDVGPLIMLNLLKMSKLKSWVY